MKIDLSHFQPLSMFNQFSKGAVKIGNVLAAGNEHSIDKKNVATSIVNDKLNAALGFPEKNKNDSGLQLDFKRVGENILGYVTDAISHAQQNGASEGELKQMLHDAKKGMQQGLNEASKELNATGLLNGEIKKGIDETKQYLKEGLKDFAERLFTPQQITPTTTSSYREANHYSLSKDASFSMTTKEGDTINITFNSDYLQQNVAILKGDKNTSEFAYSSKQSMQGAFSFAVNGDINEDEQVAINELMGSLQNVSDLFFEGNLESAFEQAKTINMDTSQLAAFSMDLQRTETVVSIKEYQQIMPGREIAQQLLPLNGQLSDAYEQAKPFAIEEHLTDLLQWLTPEAADTNQLLKYSQAVFDQLEKLDSFLPK